MIELVGTRTSNSQRPTQILYLLLSYLRLSMLMNFAETVFSPLKWRTRKMPKAGLMRKAWCQGADGDQSRISSSTVRPNIDLLTEWLIVSSGSKVKKRKEACFEY